MELLKLYLKRMRCDAALFWMKLASKHSEKAVHLREKGNKDGCIKEINKSFFFLKMAIRFSDREMVKKIRETWREESDFAVE